MHSKINNHLEKMWMLLKAAFGQLKQWFMELRWDKKLALIVIIGILIYLPIYFLGGKEKIEEVKENPKVVSLANVGELSNISTPLSLVGIVESVSEATVRAESSGQLTRVYKKLGDKVLAGQTIAEFENSSERAGVLQAEGAYEQAKAARDISTINNSTSGNSLDTAKINSLNTLSSAYITMDDIVRGKTDIAFSNPKEATPVFNVLFPNQIAIGKIEQKRAQIETLLKNREKKNNSLTVNDDLESELNLIVTELNQVKSYLEDLAIAYGESSPNDYFSQTQLDAQKAVVGALRAQIVGTISSVTGAKQALVAAKTGSQISGGVKNPSQVSSDATVKIALGAYQAALARLQKTIVRSPISGTLNSLSVETGDYISPTQQIAIVSNNNALEVTTYISSEDAKRVAIGQEVLLNEKIQAIVTRVASAIDPTNKKVEVKIGIKDDKIKLTNGQSVRVEIKGFAIANGLKNNLDSKIKIPLSAVKMTPRGAFVFFLNEDKTLKAAAVIMGAISGNDVEILEGLTFTDNIVRDARGLKEGNTVEIKDEINN